MAELNPSGYRFSTVTPDDHGGFIYIAAFLAFIYSNLTFFTRCFIKWKVLGLDDWAICFGQITFLIQFAFLLVSLSAGLGRNLKALSSDEYARMASSLYGNQIVLFVALGLSKVSTLMLVQRLFTRDAKKFWIICNIVNGTIIAWTILAACLVSAGCSPASIIPATYSQICPNLFRRYEIAVITDVFTDILLVVVPAYLVCQLQMTTKLKVQVITVFAFRLPLVPLPILSLLNFHKSLHSTNPGVDRTPAIIFQQTQLCFSLIAATLPCLKSFIRSFDTGSGLNVNYTSNGYGSSGDGVGKSWYRMHSITREGSASGDLKVIRRPFTRDGLGHGRSTSKVTTIAYTSGRPKAEDATSQELFIRRDVQWEVHSENRCSGASGDDIIIESRC